MTGRLFISQKIAKLYFSVSVNSTERQLQPACRRFVGLFIAEYPGKRGLRNRRRHIGRTRKSVWGYWQSEGEGVGGRERKKTVCPKTRLLRVADFDFVRRRTRHFNWSIYCQPSSVWSHAEKKQISETKNVGNLPIEKHSFGPDSATGRSLYCSRTHCWERTLAEYRKSQPSLFTVPPNKCWKNMCSQASCCFEVMQICDVKSICG